MAEKKDFRFDVVVGNPPYQDKAIGDNSTKLVPVYHHFIKAAYCLSDKVLLIHPARFLFNAGSTPKEWNKSMLNDEHLKVLNYEQNASLVFPNTEIKGGVVITYHDLGRNFGKMETFTPYPILNDIFLKVNNRSDFSSFSKIIYSPEVFKFTDKMHYDFPDAESRLSKSHKYDLRSNMFENLPDIFLESIPNDGHEYVAFYGRLDSKRTMRYIRKEYIKANVLIDKYSVYLPQANGNGVLGEKMAEPFISVPGIGHNQTFICIGALDNKQEAEAICKYVKTKFARALLAVLKITQANTSYKWSKVPNQNFTALSDIDWSKSIKEIDAQLYKKYCLTDEEIDFIESNVKEME